jgi:hypothetical protein
MACKNCRDTRDVFYQSVANRDWRGAASAIGRGAGIVMDKWREREREAMERTQELHRRSHEIWMEYKLKHGDRS